MTKTGKRTIAAVCAAVIFAASSAVLIGHSLKLSSAEKEYSAAQEIVGIIPNEPVPLAPEPVTGPADSVGTEAAAPPGLLESDSIAAALAETDIAALRDINPDVVGWIHIPNTVISYPLMQGSDNSFYLKHTWDGQRSSVGSIFMDYRSNSALDGFNNLIYGHRMNDGSMFQNLLLFAQQDFLDSTPYIYISDGDRVLRYAVFAAYKVSTSGECFRLDFEDQQMKQDYLDFCISQSVVKAPSLPDTEDNILTLSTCTELAATITAG